MRAERRTTRSESWLRSCVPGPVRFPAHLARTNTLIYVMGIHKRGSAVFYSDTDARRNTTCDACMHACMQSCRQKQRNIDAMVPAKLSDAYFI